MYPTISLDECKRIVGLLLDEQEVNVDDAIKWVGPEEVDVQAFEPIAQELKRDLTVFEGGGSSDKDAFEGVAAAKLHAGLRHLPLAVLDDPGFWRYLSVGLFWDVIVWREAGAFQKEWQDYRRYIDGTKQSECVPLRMYLRGQIALRDGDYGLASAVPEATDLWRSHIVRVRTSYSPVLAQGLLRMQRDDRLPTTPLRELAKRIRRVSSNVVLHLYEDGEVDQLLEELRPVSQ